MFFKRCQYPKIALHPSGIVIADVVLNHLNEFLLTGKTTTIITLSLQDAPEPFHGAVVNAVRDTGHTLRHTSLQKFMVKGSVSILEPSVAMEQWMSIRVGLNSLVKGFVDERIVIAITDHIGHDTPVAEVKDGTKIGAAPQPCHFSRSGRGGANWMWGKMQWRKKSNKERRLLKRFMSSRATPMTQQVVSFRRTEIRSSP